MTPADARLMLARRQILKAESKKYMAQIAQTRNAVLARPPVKKIIVPVSSPGVELTDYLGTFESQPDFRPFAAEGWQVKIADLTNVGALQPMAFWDHASERTQHAVADDMLTLATVALPVRAEPVPLPLQFDPVRDSWMVVSRNPNLRIIGQFSAPIDKGNGLVFTGCGFIRDFPLEKYQGE